MNMCTLDSAFFERYVISVLKGGSDAQRATPTHMSVDTY